MLGDWHSRDRDRDPQTNGELSASWWNEVGPWAIAHVFASVLTVTDESSGGVYGLKRWGITTKYMVLEVVLGFKRLCWV